MHFAARAPRATNEPEKQLAKTEYHTHVYFEPGTESEIKAENLRRLTKDTFSKTPGVHVAEKLSPNLDVDNTHFKHEFEIVVPGKQLGSMVHFMTKQRNGLTVLFHELDFKRLLPTHTSEAFFLGPLPTEPHVNPEAFVKLQEEIDSGKRKPVSDRPTQVQRPKKRAFEVIEIEDTKPVTQGRSLRQRKA